MSSLAAASAAEASSINSPATVGVRTIFPVDDGLTHLLILSRVLASSQIQSNADECVCDQVSRHSCFPVLSTPSDICPDIRSHPIRLYCYHLLYRMLWLRAVGEEADVWRY